jgi:outer membrane protein assembly factor BamB
MHRDFIARLGAVIALSISASVFADEWPQYRGPNHDGITSEKIETHWTGSGPKALWQIPLGSSLGSFVTGDHKAFVYQMHGKVPTGTETLSAVDPATGKVIWERNIDRATFYQGGGGDGPRSTPTFNDGKVYVYSTYQKLACVDATDGKPLWIHDLDAELGGKEPAWGNACSPLIEGDLIFICCGAKGQSLLAFDKKTGKIVWKGQDDHPTHASPIPVTIAGVRQIIFFTAPASKKGPSDAGLVAVEPETGKVLWRQPFKFSTSTAASPVMCGEDIVYCSAGYGVGAGAYKITKEGNQFKSTELWRKPGGDINHWSTPIYKDGYLYGLYGFKEFKKEPLKCVDVMTGEEKWSEPGFGQGQVIMVDNNLMVMGDQGQLVLVKPTPDKYEEIARCHPITGKCWTDPAIAEGKAYVRSQEGAVCLDVAPAK